MISRSHIKTLSKSKPTDVWCLDSLGEHSIRFDRLSLCSQIKAIPIEDVVAMLDKIRSEIQKLRGCSCSCSDGIIDDVEDIIDKYRESEGKE